MQKVFTANNLPYGVQYQIARYVSLDKIKYSDILFPNVFKLGTLKSNREAVPAMAQTVFKDVIIDNDDLKTGWFFTVII